MKFYARFALLRFFSSSIIHAGSYQSTGYDLTCSNLDNLSDQECFWFSMFKPSKCGTKTNKCQKLVVFFSGAEMKCKDNIQSESGTYWDLARGYADKGYIFACAQLFSDSDGSDLTPYHREAARVNRLVTQITRRMRALDGPWDGKYFLLSGVSHGASSPVIAMKHEGFDASSDWNGTHKTGACFFDGISDIYYTDAWADSTATCIDSRNRNFCSRYDRGNNCASLESKDRDKDSISSLDHAKYLAKPGDFAILNWKIIECGSSLQSTPWLSKCSLVRDTVPQAPQVNLCDRIKSDGSHTCEFSSFPIVPHLECVDTYTNEACSGWFDQLIK